MLCLTGVQMSIYAMSTWQYLKEANPLFGYWNQQTLSAKAPTTFGFIVAALGTLGVLRSFIGTASNRKDRVRAVSLGTAGQTTGLSLGPAIQICFLPLGSEGYYIGPIALNMYTSAAFFMCAISLLSVVLVNTLFVEDYAGIISDDEKKGDPFLVIPKFDRVAVGQRCEFRLSAPITIAMYDWTHEEAVFYNGVIQTISCAVSTFTYFIIGSTRVGNWDRRVNLSLGLIGFLFCYVCHYPMPFYDGPLNQRQHGNPILWASLFDFTVKS
ncbi:unnamed protein product [Nippostrongylus brasiliensis]|uniref:Nucleobase-ascorbate transporter 7 n=1 Tax=Nippostrongylus brasiliensis TaxID=27835 RepID=A0A0N4XZZ0_NIPBR|nr:unnamed protein product [Nippostrongylus brasiliensis]